MSLTRKKSAGIDCYHASCGVKRSSYGWWAALFVVCEALVGGCSSPDSVSIATATDLQEACEQQIANEGAAEVVDTAHGPHLSRSVELPEQVGRVVGARLDRAEERVYLLDASNGRVHVVSLDGQILDGFGRLGEGPGEFDFGAVLPGKTNRLALIGDSLVVVGDMRQVQVFTHEGLLEASSRIERSPGDSRSDLHVAGGGDEAALVSRSGKLWLRTNDREQRTRLELVPVDAKSLRQLGAPITLRNTFVTLLPFSGAYPSYQPYREAFKRTWDANGGIIAAIAFRSFGVCWLSPSGQILASGAVAAPPVPTDRSERARVLAEEWGGEGPVPGTGKSPSELYQDRWPEFAPRYTDLVLLPDSSIVALRRTPSGDRVADWFRFADGYRGSMPWTSARLPDDFGLTLAISVTVDSSAILLNIFEWGANAGRPVEGSRRP
jgi:hypothetical protein